MKKFTSRILEMTILIGLILNSLSCSKDPNGEEESSRAAPEEQASSAAASLNEVLPTNSTQISLDQAENGVVIRLIGEGDNGIWRLKDSQNDIEVKKMDNDMIAIKASITIQEGGIVQIKQVNTQIKTTPGEIVVLARTSNRTISFECPSN
ncbi:MAG TPA: hypothetical protein VMW72_07535 [Sedimentisphaerales bacterium]|nr:hypothetical protein [Sedimentisphaerales bacterium]